MSHLESKGRFSIDQTTLYKRYVDDILIFAATPDCAQSVYNELNGSHPNIKLNYDAEENEQLPFLDILLCRKESGTISRSVYRKSKWTGQYIHFQSYCPLYHKRGIVRTLFNRARGICTSDKLDEEIETIRLALISNGYPASFVDKFQSPREPKPEVQLAERKRVYLEIPYKGEQMLIQTRQRIRSAINRAYNAAQLILLVKTKPLPVSAIWGSAVDNVTSHVIYEWVCGCGNTYIGRTNRQLSSRINEHVPKWLHDQLGSGNPHINSGGRNPNSSIGKHLLDNPHCVNARERFRIIFRSTKATVLRFAEALAIKTFNPLLCVHKQFVITLNLPW
jgi:hypothetical protein